METDHEEFGRQQLDSLYFEPPYDPEAELTDPIQEAIEQLSTECEGMFLLLDTAKHNGFNRSVQELKDHIRECAVCMQVNGEFLDV